MAALYADIILPLSVKGRYTYRIPEHFAGKIVNGARVKVRFGKRNTYSGIVAAIHGREPASVEVREIEDVPGDTPFINDLQANLWAWISEYYMCHEGEVMKAALPADKAIEGYKPRYETYISLSREYSEKELNEILDKLKKAPRQYEFLSELIRLSAYKEGMPVSPVKKSILAQETSSNAITSLTKRGVIRALPVPVSRLNQERDVITQVNELSESQKKAFDLIKRQFKDKEIVLLHGVTSSGKTEIYIHLIEEQLKLGRQVLYMLPEIALTTQIIFRLRKHFGSMTGVYHSRFSDSEKMEIWNRVADPDPSAGYRLILGVRSSVFLPFSNIGLVIIDEEHDQSYKQQDPAPRYHARDCAIMLAHIHGAKTLLGSASPSIESYHNAVTGKYGLAELTERFGLVMLPEIILANTREAYRRKLMVSDFTPELINSIDDALSREEQVILFRNRRGFSPYIECSDCGWVPTCVQCAVNLTYHKTINRLVCHYCGYTSNLPHKCGNCSSSGIITKGFGTEKIEDEIKIIFSGARVARMDQDTTRTKNSFDRIIKAFEEKRIDILIGTQMIAKGLDFENLTIVGILNADTMLNYPDFRSHERSFQMMEQVSGRAGRRKKHGRVIIQTADPMNKIIRYVTRHDYRGMFLNQIEERKAFNYPPFCRMVKISVKHKNREHLNHFADILGSDLRAVFGKRVLGPEAPVIYRVQLWYIKTIIIKIEREKPSSKAKKLILDVIDKVEKEKGASALRIAIDVDPY